MVATRLEPSRSDGLGYEDLMGLIGLMTGDEKHSSSSVSMLDVVWVLYDRILDVSADDPSDPDRDYFLLSKGHGPLAYYAVLAAKGFIDPDVLGTFGQFSSVLGHHPDHLLIDGIEVSSGSLGHGLPMAVGLALALRAQGRNEQRVFCLIGDGELDEGSNAEAIAFASRTALGRLTVIVLDNDSSALGWPGGIARRFQVEGWAAQTIDGTDHTEIFQALSPSDDTRPTAVIAKVN